MTKKSELPEYVMDGFYNFLRVSLDGVNVRLTVHSGEYAEVSVTKLRKLLKTNGLRAVPSQVASAFNNNPQAAKAMSKILNIATKYRDSKNDKN